MQVYCCPTIQMFSLTSRAADFQRSGLTVKENLELTYRIFKALSIIIFYANKSEKLFSFVHVFCSLYAAPAVCDEKTQANTSRGGDLFNKKLKGTFNAHFQLHFSCSWSFV